MVFPTSYLPSNSQPWGREVEKRIEKTETALNRATVNNDARDNQLAAAMDRLNATVNSTKAAVDSITTVEEAVFVPGTTEINGGNIAANTIAANKISAGKMIGFDIQTNVDGQSRVALSGSNNQLEFYSGSSLFGTMSGGASIGPGGQTYNGVTVGGTLAAMSGLLASSATVVGTVDCDYLTSGSIGTGDISCGDVSGGAGTFSLGLNVLGVSYTSTINASGSVNTDGNLTRTGLSGGGTTGASFNNNGSLVRTTSSQRYKTDIAPLSILYADIMALQPCTFKRIEEVEENPETARNYPGFIAEDLADTSLDVFVFRNTEGQPEGIHYAELSAALLSALQTQNSLIENLTQRIEALENK